MLNGKIDWIWPSIPAPSLDTIKKEEALTNALIGRVASAVNSSSLESVGRIEERVRELARNEEDRGTEVGAKLATVLGFFAIAASLGIALFAVAHADLDGRFHGNQRLVAAFAAAVALYVELQLVAVCRAGLRGLERQGYLYFDLDDAIPQNNETDLDIIRRRTLLRAKILMNMESIVNRKVSHMSVAHVAIRNAAHGLLIMVAALCLLLILRVLEMRDTRSAVSPGAGASAPELAAELQPAQVMPSTTQVPADSARATQVADTTRTPRSTEPIR